MTPHIPRAHRAGLVVAVLAAALAGPLVAAQHDVTVPIVLSLGGLNGSYYTSELTLTNRGAATLTLTFTYAAAFGGGSGTATDTLAPRQQRIVPDAIAYLRGLGAPIPAEGNRAGTLAVRFDGVSGGADASASVRTTTAVPGGSAGLAYGAVGPAQQQSGPVYLCGLRQNEQDRSNLALLNVGAPGSGSIKLRVTLFSGETGAASEPIDTTLEPGGFAQITEVLAGAGLASGYARVERVEGSAPYDAYAVINDQRNSDGSFVPALRPESLVGRDQVTLPVVVETGAFSTELVVTSFAGPDRVLSLQYVAQAAHHIDVEMPVPAGKQLIIPEIVQWLRERTSAVPARGVDLAGALFIFVPNGDTTGLFVGARASTPGGGGRFGLFYTAVPSGSALDGTSWLSGLQQNATNRTNLALVNTAHRDASSDTFRLEIFNGDTGVLVATVNNVLVHQKGWTQYNAILAQYAPGVTNAYVRISRVSGTNPYIAYAVVNDGGAPGQRSGDGAYLAAEAACSFTVSPTADSLDATAGDGSVAVTASAGCSWTASTETPWLRITGGAFGTGNGTVSYSHTANGSRDARTGTITVAGQTVTFSQAGSEGPLY